MKVVDSTIREFNTLGVVFYFDLPILERRKFISLKLTFPGRDVSNGRSYI